MKGLSEGVVPFSLSLTSSVAPSQRVRARGNHSRLRVLSMKPVWMPVSGVAVEGGVSWLGYGVGST